MSEQSGLVLQCETQKHLYCAGSALRARPQAGRVRLQVAKNNWQRNRLVHPSQVWRGSGARRVQALPHRHPHRQSEERENLLLLSAVVVQVGIQEERFREW